jgi:LacI family transcriptional regulator
MDVKVQTKSGKPRSAKELIALLQKGTGDFGKGSRRLADFFVSSPSETALLTSAEVAERCGVHASSVVRLAQGLGFSGFRELQALFQRDLSASLAGSNPSFRKTQKSQTSLKLHMIGESGRSFNLAAQAAAHRFCEANNGVAITSDFRLPHEVEPQDMAHQIEAVAKQVDALILVAREHPAINAAVRSVTSRGTPVVCLTTDLPSSTRTVYVGSDQFASGATAGWFCGRMLPKDQAGQVLFVYSVPFRCQLDREQGFRQVLRAEFPALTIDERVGSNESVEVIYDAVRHYVASHGPPAAIYNVSGANSGIGRALEDEGLAGKTIFVGHELNDNSRRFLERGTMDLAIGHDFSREISMAVECIRSALQGVQPVKHLTPSQLFTRHNCAII